MRPGAIVAVLAVWWIAVSQFPALGRGWVGFIGGCASVWLVYLLLRATPERPGGEDTGRDHHDSGRD